MPINKTDIESAGGLAKYAQNMFNNMLPFGEETPVQAEVTSTDSQRSSFFALGTVVQTLDGQRAGRIRVVSPVFPEGAQTCDYVSPVAGAGYGFFAVPGIGATVLIAKVASTDPPSQNVWLGCLYAPGQKDLPDTKTHPYILGDATQLPKNEVMDNGEAPPNEPTLSYGVPNESDVYRDNDLPDSFVLKHPKGHSISLTDKNTSERKINEIKLKTGGNKRLIMSDAPAPTGGENITLIDENDNQVKITSVGHGTVGDDSIITRVGGDVEVHTETGAMEHTISPNSVKDFSVDNLGAGNIELTAHKGTITLEADQKITLKCGGCSITMSKDTMNIDAPTMAINASNGTLNFGSGSITVGGAVNSTSVNTEIATTTSIITTTISIAGEDFKSHKHTGGHNGGNTGGVI